MNKVPSLILIADDDPDDCLLIREAFKEAEIVNPLYFVHDGEELIRYLKHRTPYSDSNQYPLPGLILLDLNMPLMDGREALNEIRGDQQLHHLPVVILTTSSAEEDIAHSYKAGVSAFLTKPVTFSGLLELVREFGRKWPDLVEFSNSKDPL
ncbi:response regulator receiver domain-containing protein [Pseudomonas duriflava]|uniref:Response regulator receiver domain-containing protein n=1 Tax=Pseudomonas duriflava TaxID=459528 RepID=A0A562QRG5_9PSED|nr:response regulator [Pseudomonas duriflava]TWI58676.1 response regulator receiver domain-containing protein [Pseudomonas duriflava]